MSFRAGVDIASIEIDAIGVDTIMAPSNSVWVKDGKQVKDEAIA